MTLDEIKFGGFFIKYITKYQPYPIVITHLFKLVNKIY